jgi:3-methyladenine DNA glycosylase AlkD
MNKSEVLAMLEDNKNERGMEHWQKSGSKTGKLKSYGIGLSVLRKLAKKIGLDHQLAKKLWKSNYYDAKVLGLLIDDPKMITREQAEAQVEDLADGLLVHVYSSCGATLAKTPFARELALEWARSRDTSRQRTAWGLMYEFSKDNTRKAPDDSFFLEQIQCIEQTIHKQEMWVRESMSGALMGIGKRNKKLNKAAIKAVKTIGPTDIDYGADNSCEPIDVMKHLTSDYLRKKFNG